MSGGSKGAALEADWIGACRRAVERLETMFGLYPTTAARAVEVGLGVGGDNTLVVDQAAEDIVFEQLDALHAEGHEFTAISEERGEVVFGGAAASEVYVVIDPIDGSLNAKRLLPTHALSIAVACGETMEDVELGFVHDFGSGEQYVAERRKGATLDGEPLDPDLCNESLELVGFESARPGWVAPVAGMLADDVFRMRVLGTIAMTLCYVGAARFDGMLTMSTCRSVDAAAAQLIVREAGGFVSVLGHGGLEAPLSLDARYRIAAARSPAHLETLVGVLVESGMPA